MRKILTQTEIEALLASSPDSGGAPRSAGTDGVVTYNFRRPDRVSKEQTRSLHYLHDRFARNASSSLAAFMRTTTELAIVSVEQMAYSEFLMALPDPTAFYGVAMSTIDTLGALEMNPSVAFTIVDRLLGGGGRAAAPERALSEIELDVVDSVIRLLLDQLTDTWKASGGLKFKIQGRETRPQMLQVAGRNETVVLLSFDLRVGEIRGLLNLCLPADAVESAGAAFGQGGQLARREPTHQENAWLIENVGRVQVPLTINLRTMLTTRELIGLSPGQVLALGVPLKSSIDVRVGDLVKFKGHLAVADGFAAVKIRENCGRHVYHPEEQLP